MLRPMVFARGGDLIKCSCGCSSFIARSKNLDFESWHPANIVMQHQQQQQQQLQLIAATASAAVAVSAVPTAEAAKNRKGHKKEEEVVDKKNAQIDLALPRDPLYFAQVTHIDPLYSCTV